MKRIIFMAGFLLCCVIVGFLIGVDASIAIKSFAFLFLLVLVVIASSLGKVQMEWRLSPLINLFCVIFMCACIIWPKYGILKVGGLPSISPSKILYAIIFLLFIFSLFFDKNTVHRLLFDVKRMSLLYIGWGIYVFFKSLSIFVLDDLTSGYQLKYVIEQVFGYEFIFIVILSQIKTMADLERYLGVFLFVVFPLAVISLLERSMGRTIFSYIVSVDYDESGRAAEVIMTKIRDGFHRLQGSFEHPLVFGQYLVSSVPVLIYFSLSKADSFYRKWLSFFSLVVTLILIYMTGSRSSLALGLLASGMMISLSPLLVKRFKLDIQMILRVIGVLLITSVVIYVFSIIIPDIVSSNSAQAANSSAAREYMLVHGLPHIAERPLFGNGPGMGVYLAGVIVTGGLYSIDNYYLSLALDSGIFALIGFVMTLVYAVWLFFKSYMQLDDVRIRLFVICLSISAILYAATLSVLSIPDYHRDSASFSNR